MKKKKKKQLVDLCQVRKDLDYYIINLNETCERCGKPLIVHGFRRKTDKKRQAVYAACWNDNPICSKRGMEICFVQQL